LATEESSTTMNVASITETATIQGFTEGFHSLWAASTALDDLLTMESF